MINYLPKGVAMNREIIIVLGGSLLVIIFQFVWLHIYLRRRFASVGTILAKQTAALAKIHSEIKTKSDIGTVIEHADIIYQDLAQHLAPIMSALEIQPRDSSEHVLWRSLGGIMDEYAKNPYVLEQLRRGIKLDADFERNVESFMTRADRLLHHLSDADPDGILSTAFAEGLLGQSITLFTQARHLAQDD
jgi:hypothetical protein